MQSTTRITSQPVLRASGLRLGPAKQRVTAAWLTTARLSSTVHGNDAETLETEKSRNLKNIQHKTSTPHKHAPGWNEYLATSSEASVKADKATGATLSELQQSTVQHISTRHPHTAKTTDKYEASFSKENVSGPLKSAGPGEKDTDGLVKRTVSEQKSGKWKDESEKMTGSEESVKAERETFA
ncbi:hypothetical protein MIND_00803600 [Mycena indigotica]|uniref:Uncharacterized protein n=1 Tax=Mycena indigotica TaxID=2126181 RepID=A0A8H6W435_9AGAR|nr:uncharacterized protein MIND_00803600 [Mycena indigotica]KAF7298569.1 hypothetical protein MIND_00803600 [Mycena indigotica]